MKETSKTNSVRDAHFASTFLSGRVIDIGCANDPVCPSAERFDLADGDANCILDFRAARSYDTVYSSHCLEHMSDISGALAQWWELVRPGGYLVLVVPHEDLYEQGFWPSIFNSDHKATFRLGGDTSWSPVSFDISRLVGQLPFAEIVSLTVHDQGYDRSMIAKGRKDMPLLRKVLFRITRLLSAMGKPGQSFIQALNSLAYRIGCPVDQTLGDALAQIQIIARKAP